MVGGGDSDHGWLPTGRSESLEVSACSGVLEAAELAPAECVAWSTQKPVADTHAPLAIRATRGVAPPATDEEMLLAVRDLGARGPPC